MKPYLKFPFLIWSFVPILFLALVAHPVSAAKLTLKDGKVVEGKYMGGTQETIIFETSGSMQIFQLTDVLNVDFSVSSQPRAAQQVEKKAMKITVPAGTRVMVALDQAVSTGRHGAGHRFTATLQADMVADGQVAASTGSKIHGKVTQARKGRGVRKAMIELTLTDITINQQLQPIMTNNFGLEGERQGALRKMAAGAAVGAIADGGDGARKGTAVGAGLAVLSPKKQIELQPGVPFEFRLQQPLTVTVQP